MAKVKLGLADMTVLEKGQFGDTVHTSMTGNANFPTPNPPLTAVRTATDELTAAAEAVRLAKLALQAKVDVQDQKEVAFDLVLTQEGNYIETASGGDPVRILSAGVQVQAGRTPPAPMSKVDDLSATGGDMPGECDLNHKPVKNKKNYIVEVSPDPVTATSWKQAGLPSKSSFTVTGLTSGDKYWFRVAAIGTLGPGPFSDPATARAS
jgi:hypothetical protein